ncbi:MAG: hypothetical protein AB1671_29140, partial [Thermodesulfobacteriota bacterium]
METTAGVKAAVHIPQGGTSRGPSHELFRAKDPVTIVIFGASGDLSKRKLIPALYQLHNAGYLPDRYAVVGFSRTPMSDEAYRANMVEALKEQSEDGGGGVSAAHPLVAALYYQPGNNDDLDSFRKLKEKLEAIDRERDLPGNRLFYLSVAPEFFTTIIQNLCAAGLICGR